jgi:asparagine N-glycosylation enzyme membrane subunit Stt3
MRGLEKADWWGSSRRSRATLLCILCVGLVFLFVILSPRGWVGLVAGLFIGGGNVCTSPFTPIPDSIRDASQLLNQEGPNSTRGCFIESCSLQAALLLSGILLGYSFFTGVRFKLTAQ